MKVTSNIIQNLITNWIGKGLYLELVSDKHLLWGNDWNFEKGLKVHQGFASGEEVGDVSYLAQLNLGDNLVEVSTHVKDIGDRFDPRWNSAISILATIFKSINNFLVEVHGVSDFTIVILDWHSGQESQKVDDFLDDNDEKLWVDGLDGSKLIEVNITNDLFKFGKVVHNLFFHSVFVMGANSTHVVEDCHHIINVGSINLVLFDLSFIKSFLKLFLPLYAKTLKLFNLLFLLDFLSLLEDVANLIKGNHGHVFESHTMDTIEIPITVIRHEFTEFGWVLHIWVNGVRVRWLLRSLFWSVDPFTVQKAVINTSATFVLIHVVQVSVYALCLSSHLECYF